MITNYSIKCSKADRALTFALVPDFHDHPKAFRMVREAFEARKPDVILIPGDICNDHFRDSEHAADFLRYCVSVAPTYFSLGNHEYQFDASDFEAVRETGVHFLNDSFETAAFSGVTFTVGGLRSAGRTGRGEFLKKDRIAPETGWLDAFGRSAGIRLLLCHHPEYYPKYLKNRDLDLIVAGHAHGGQIRLGKWLPGTRVGSFPLYAPGQGFFPKLTSGVIDGRLVISRGLCNHSFPVPRLFNTPEVVYITIEKADL